MSDVTVTLDGILAAVKALRADPAIAPYLPPREPAIPPADDPHPPVAAISRDDPQYRQGYLRGNAHADRIANINTAHWVRGKGDAWCCGYLDGLADGFAGWLRFAARDVRVARAVRDGNRAEFERCRRCGHIRAQCAEGDHAFLPSGEYPSWAPA